MKSRKSTLAKLRTIIPSATVDHWGDIEAFHKNCRVLVFTGGPRRSPSSIQVYSTVYCPENERLTRPFSLAKLVAKTLNFPVTFSAAERMIAAVVNP